MPRRAQIHPPELVCINCKRRKKHARYDYCASCRTLLIVDKVLPKPVIVPFEVRYKDVVERMERGMNYPEIAKEMGITKGYVANIVGQARTLGLPVPPVSYRNGHGKGKRGIDGCDCAACKGKRAQYKKDWNREHPRVKPPRKTVGHGEGTAGIRGCNCTHCREARRKYKQDWSQKRKANASVAQSGSSS